MRALVEHLRAEPSDLAAWQVFADLVLEKGLQLEEAEIRELEVLFSKLAQDHPAVGRLAQGSLTLGVRGGQPRIYRAAEGGWWEAAAADLGGLAERVEAPGLEAAAGRALRCLELAGEVEPWGLRAVRWLQVVETVTDPERECTSAQFPAEEAQLGEELGVVLPFESQLVALMLLLVLRQVRPLRIVPPPDPEREVEEALAQEAAHTGLSVGEIVQRLEEGVSCPNLHDPPRPLRLYPSGEGLRLVFPVGEEAFDRGAFELEAAGSLIREAISHWSLQLEEPLVTTLGRLLPLRGEVVLALVRRFRQEAPLTLTRATGQARRLDDYEVAARFRALPEPERVRRLWEVGARLVEELAPGEQELGRELLAMVGEDVDPSTLELEPFCELIERDCHDLVHVLLFLADLASRRRGQRPFSAAWGGDALGVQDVSPILALYEVEVQ
jgi:hypothetical protein